MEGLNICTWHWGKKYSNEYVEKLRAAVARNVEQEYKFCVFSPQAEDEYLTKIPGCFARLRMFDPEWQQQHHLEGRIVCMDLDVVITGQLDAIFDRPEKFTILHGGNFKNPCPYNGSLWMLRSGKRPDVWKDFTLKNANSVPFYEYPDDQGWFAHKIPDAAGWKVGEGGIYCFQKPGWPKGDQLPNDARLVAFPGWRDPSKFAQLGWVKDNWR